jgi:hypothetical protein
MKLFTKLFIAFLIFQSPKLSAHNRGGRIEVNHVSGLDYEIKIITYTKTSSIQQDRPQLDSVYLGDSPNSTIFVRDSIIDLPNDFRINIYSKTHTYPAAGRYKVHFSDPGRAEVLGNMISSLTTTMHLETEFTIDPTSCFDSSPHLYTHPLMLHSYQKDLILSRAGSDSNWDSLSYNQDTCMDGLGSYAMQLFPLAEIDPVSGTFKWDHDSMISPGFFNFAIRIYEWRQGVQIGYVHEEFEILLDNSIDSNHYFNTSMYPPGFMTHVLPGDTFQLHVEYTDIFSSQAISYYSDLTNYNWNYYVSGFIEYGDLSFIASQNEVRNDPYRILFNGKTDLTYLVYVDGTPNQNCISVGAGDLEETKSVHVFPNPSDGVIHLGINGHGAEIILFNEVGEIVLQNNNFNSETINLQTLTSGIYILRIKQGQTFHYAKIVRL